jgi:hypothetical protein
MVRNTSDHYPDPRVTIWIIRTHCPNNQIPHVTRLTIYPTPDISHLSIYGDIHTGFGWSAFGHAPTLIPLHYIPSPFIVSLYRTLETLCFQCFILISNLWPSSSIKTPCTLPGMQATVPLSADSTLSFLPLLYMPWSSTVTLVVCVCSILSPSETERTSVSTPNSLSYTSKCFQPS